MTLPLYEGPVEQHPATARLRSEIEALEALTPSPERDTLLDLLRDDMRRYNAGVYEFRARTFLAAERSRS